MIDIQAAMKELFGNSCQAYCYAYIAHPKAGIRQLTNCVLKGWNEHNIENSGYVQRPVVYYNSLMPADGRNIKDIRKVPISSLNELPSEGMFSVEFKLFPSAKASHFAVCEKDKIIFDPAGESNTCACGSPVSYREFIYE